MKILRCLSILLLTLHFLPVDAQRIILGTVTDAQTGLPLPGAHITYENENNGTVTGFDGTYQVVWTQSKGRLKFSYPGFAEAWWLPQQSDTLDVALTPTEMMRYDTVITFDPETYEEQIQIIRSDGLFQNQPKQQAYSFLHDLNPDFLYNGLPEGNTEDYSPIEENNDKSPLDDPLSTFSIDVDNASYSNIRRFINNHQRPPADAVRIEEMVNYFDYDYPQPKDRHPFSITTEHSDCPWNPERQLLLIGLQGKDVVYENLPPSNLTFLLDVSGSMKADNKLPLVKSAMRLLVEQLRPDDKVAIVVYAGAAGLVLPPTSGADKQTILDAIERLEAGGSTAGGAGIQLAYKTALENFLQDGNNRVILATDGDFNVGMSSDGEMTRLIGEKRKDHIFRTVLGFGMGNYKDNKLELLADEGNGNYAYIDNMLEAKKVFVQDLRANLFTIAKDVKIQVEFNPQVVKSYRLVGYENRLLNKEDFNDDTKDAGELGAGHRVTAFYELVLKEKNEPAPTSSGEVDPLRYQQHALTKTALSGKELATVKFRYKPPTGEESERIEQPVFNKKISLDKTSDNFRFAAAVATFGMMLRGSAFSKSLDFQAVLDLAKGASGKDPFGYRAEFLRLVGLASLQ